MGYGRIGNAVIDPAEPLNGTADKRPHCLAVGGIDLLGMETVLMACGERRSTIARPSPREPPEMIAVVGMLATVTPDGGEPFPPDW